MKKLILFVLVAAAVALFSRCEPDDGSDGQAFREPIIIEGFVYANEPVTRIMLSKFHGSGSLQSTPISDARVVVEQGDKSFNLQISDSVPGLYVQADTTHVPDGNRTVTVKIDYGGARYSAFSAMPEEITGLQISESQIFIQGSTDDQVLTELTWNPHPGGKYCVFLRQDGRNVPLGGSSTFGTMDSPFGRILTTPNLGLEARAFPSKGSFTLYVTAVNEDYAQLYAAPPGMNLAGVPGNFSGSVGVFTAFKGNLVELEVY